MISLESNPTHIQPLIKKEFLPHILNNLSSSTKPMEFDWKNKWLRGEEYAYILNNIDIYCKSFKMQKLPAKTHPPSIYTEPEDGMIYFVEGNSVGSDFGFPRVDIKKRYRWKKMNFTTDLPKKRPCVTYIVASAVKCGKFFPNSKEEGPSFRMHAVILNKDGVHTQKYKNKEAIQGLNFPDESYSSLSTTCSSIAENTENEKNEVLVDDNQDRKKVKKESKSYVLCHIRKIDQNYKASKPIGKRGNPYGDDEGEENEEDSDESQSLSRKVVCVQNNSIIAEKAKQKSKKEESIHFKPSQYNSIDKIPIPVSTQDEIHKELLSLSEGNSIDFNPNSMNLYSEKDLTQENTFKNFSTLKYSFKLSPRQNTKIQDFKNEGISTNSKGDSLNDRILLQQLNQNDFANVDYLALFNNLVNHKTF